MELNTDIPPWLQRNWGPTGSSQVDISPWLQQGFEAGIQMQKLQIAKQQAELNFEHQGLINEALSRDLQDQKDDTPIFNEWFQTYSKDPIGLVDSPAPAVKSQKFRQMVLDAKHMAAQTTLARTYQEEQIQTLKQVNDLKRAGVDITPAIIENDRGPSFPPSYEPAMISKMWNEVNERVQKEKLQAIEARNTWRFDPETGERIVGGGKGTAAIQNSQYLASLKREIDDAETNGDYVTAESKREQLKLFEASLPGAWRMSKLPEPERLKVNSLYGKIASLRKAREKLIETDPNYGTPQEANRAERMRIMFEESELQRQIDEIVNKSKGSSEIQPSQSPSEPPAAPASTNQPSKRLRWTPQGLVPVQ